MKKALAAALLVLMISSLCACKKAEKKPQLNLNEPNQNQSQAVDEKIKGVTVTVQDCSEFTDQQMEKIRLWRQCPIDQELYILLYEDTDIAALYGIPEVLDGYWSVEDYHNDAGATVDVTALFMRETYNFVLSVYDYQQQTLYEIHYNNED